MDVTYGLNAYRTTGQLLKLDILQSKAGWYIGTIDHDGPVSRESGYYKTPKQLMTPCVPATGSNTSTKQVSAL